MGALMRAHDWRSTSLGPPEAWPQPLRTVIRLLLNTGHPMYIWWGPELLCFYNDAYSLSIGPERHPSSLGQPARAVWAEIWEVIGPQIEQVMTGKGATWHENQLIPISRHGRLEEVYWTYSYGPIDDDSAAPFGVGGVLVVCTETTQQVLSEQRLRAAEARWRALFDQAPSFMCVLSGPEHRFEYANPRYRELIGPRDIMGRPLVEALPEVVQQGFVTLLDQVYVTGETYSATAAPVMLPRGLHAGVLEQRYVDFVYQPIRDGGGAVTGILVEGSDVTDRVLTSTALADSEARFRALAETLRESDRRKDEFLAILAHELRNPLAPVRNAARVLRAQTADATMREWATTVIDRQIQAMSGLLDDLLDVSRITRGQITLNKQRISLSSVVDASLEVSRPLIEARKHTLSILLPPEPIELDTDPLRLSQVLSNLLTNAAKYMDIGGLIELRAHVQNGEVCIAVRDQGIGLEPESLTAIFEMFSQIKTALDRSEGGLGIGLALVRGLVALHGGRIEASSEGLGRGSEFRVWLPTPSETSAGAHISTPPASQTASTPRRILVVDDNRDAAESLGFLLEHSGHAVRLAHDGQEALLAARDYRPDIAFLDIGLPKLDGYELSQAIRRESWGERIVLFALTGWGHETDRQRARAAGFNGHLTKPIDPDSIDTLVAEKLDPRAWRD
jgi:signal transduction histidine kinase/ActR/RegA family two-component response regulator